MVELVLVAGIILTLSAIALPTLSKLLTSAQLRGGMGDISGLYQNARNLAVRQNNLSQIRFQSSNNRWTAYIDNGANPTGLTGSTPQVVLPPQFKKVNPPSGSNPSPVTNATCGTATGNTLETTNDTYFNQMGIPCQYSSGVCSGSQAFAHYFTYSETSANSNWAALCVSPAGRIKAWYWTGSAWTN
jgi:Tfp pilus assembly protein FimT